MKLLDILELHHVELPFHLGLEIGSGIDGQVFESQDNSNRVIKISSANSSSIASGYPQIAKILRSVQIGKIHHFVKIYSFGPLFTYPIPDLSRDTATIFFVEMEKLFPISEDEQKIFHTLVSHEDANKKKKFPTKQIISILEDLSRWLSFDKEKAKNFCIAATSGPIYHKDLHIRNVMKNARGDYKLVDLDRLEIFLELLT